MGREFHVRFREGLGVQFPRATRLVIGFANEADARRVLEVLPKRFGKYGLELHPDKTRLIPFVRPSDRSSGEPAKAFPQPGTFDLLGFTHYWGRSRRGGWVVKRRTARSRFRRALQRIADWCRRHAHRPIGEQQQTLGQKLRGHFAYFGITGNAEALQRFREAVTRLWKKWLGRRQRRGYFNWGRFTELLQRFPLPPARVVQSVYRLAAKPVT